MEAITIQGRPYISALQAANELKKSACTLLKAARSGAFKAVNINGAFVDVQEFQAWAKQQGQKKQNSN